MEWKPFQVEQIKHEKCQQCPLICIQIWSAQKLICFYLPPNVNTMECSYWHTALYYLFYDLKKMH